MNQTFNPEEWLATQKKGFGGKVSREVFIAKLKELGEEIELLKKDKVQLANQKQALEDKLKTSQTELTNRDQIIQEKDKELAETEKELTTKLSEQEKVLQSKDNELKILQKRPDITNEKYQELQSNLSDLQSKCDELLNSQEKHKEEDLKPENLPAD